MSRHSAPVRHHSLASLAVAPLRISGSLFLAWCKAAPGLTLATVRTIVLLSAAIIWTALTLSLLLASLTTRRQGAVIRRNVRELMITPVVERIGAPREAASRRTLPTLSTMMSKLA